LGHAILHATYPATARTPVASTGSATAWTASTATGRRKKTSVQPASNVEINVNESAKSAREGRNVRPNPSLSPRPATAGHARREAGLFMLRFAAGASCLRGRG
jgi:hypothetical protein